MKNGLVNLFFAGGCKQQRGIAAKKSSDLQELKVVSWNNAGDDYSFSDGGADQSAPSSLCCAVARKSDFTLNAPKLWITRFLTVWL
jgi:hypothetical protein